MRQVGWAQSSALLVRRQAAEEVGFLDQDFFVYSDETDFCKRLGDAGWRILFVPTARALHHDQLSTDRAAMRRRIVEFHRGRDLYFAKHGLLARAAGLAGVLDLGLSGPGGRRRPSCPGTIPGATSCMRANRPSRAWERACGRPRRRTTAGAEPG